MTSLSVTTWNRSFKEFDGNKSGPFDQYIKPVCLRIEEELTKRRKTDVNVGGRGNGLCRTSIIIFFYRSKDY